MTFRFSSETNELFKNEKLIGHTYDNYAVLVDKTGVVDFGFIDETEYGGKKLKVSKRKLRKKQYRIYNLPFHHDAVYLEMMNKIHVGYDIVPELYAIREKELRNHEIFKEIETHLNEIILTTGFHHVNRLIGLAFDLSDLYYISKSWNGKIYYDTCVGGFIELKNKIDARKYDNLDYPFSTDRSKCPPVDMPILEMLDDSVYFNWHMPRDGKITKRQLISEWFDAKCFWLRRKIVAVLQD